MNNNIFLGLIKQKPQAIAKIQGSVDYPGIKGTVLFYQMREGVIVITQILGLPKNNDVCRQPVFAFHIHSGGKCSGNETDRFADAMSHYNPNNCPHPYHAGDMPPLFGTDGYALSAFLSGRFTVNEVIGKTVIIHSNPDDFTTQPSGNSGIKLACGIIERYR
ncbi:MAG: superoxide dismutase family protein [Clostridia bacterium]|nr:superoxide dismutase family protein [Clostridia bacterium]